MQATPYPVVKKRPGSYERTDEIRKRMSDSLKGRVAWNKGRRTLISLNCTTCGIEFKRTPFLAKIPKNNFCSSVCYMRSSLPNGRFIKGRKHTDEVRNKLSASSPHREYVMSDQTKNKIKTKLLGKRNSPNTEFKKGQFTGEKNPSWLGGIGKLPYPYQFNRELKQRIRERDNYECKNCRMTEEEHLIVYGQVLHVHHIDYVKANLADDNLMAACQSCNFRFNNNREYWKEVLCRKP